MADLDELEVQRNYLKDSFKNPITSGPYRTQPRNGRGSMGNDYFDSWLPGTNFFKDVIAGSTPRKPGVYLVFYEYSPPSAWSAVERISPPGAGLWDGKQWESLKIAGIAVANYQNQRWGINVRILAYLGPIPTLNLKSLLECTPGYPMNITFYISTLKMAASGKVSSGPHAEYIHASLTAGYPGEYIFKKTSDATYLIPVARYNPLHKAIVKWQALTELEIAEAIKEMKE